MNTMLFYVLPQKDPNWRYDDTLSKIDYWSNDMAQGMMPLEEEMAAFGEVMPEPKYNKEACKENQDPHDYH